MDTVDILVAGGGAAGYFGAITAAEKDPSRRVLLLEAANEPLKKVAISGGGRCNVTQAQFDPKELTRGYPRGAQELLGPFHRFQPKDTMEWFEQRGVSLKTEADRRVFPVSDSSATIIDCLEAARKAAGVELRKKTKLVGLEKSNDGFIAKLQSAGKTADIGCKSVLLAPGSTSAGYNIVAALGHTIEPPVPSLFTFEIPDPELHELAGVSTAAGLALEVEGEKPFFDEGPLLITHWGLSGPAVIRLSAWAARPLARTKYQAKIVVSWCVAAKFRGALSRARDEFAKRAVAAQPLFDTLPKRLWTYLVSSAKIDGERIYAELRREESERLERELTEKTFSITGKGVFKEEFVTCGGVRRSEVDWRTMESKLVPGLYFAGEILDVDGITGGYNFQSAWTMGWIAGGGL